MDVVNIFLTDRNAETMDDFVHAGRRYTFRGSTPLGRNDWSKDPSGRSSTGCSTI